MRRPKNVVSRSKEAAAGNLPVGMRLHVTVARIRLRRAQDVLSVLAFCSDREADLSLGPLAVVARDLIERALEGLAKLVPDPEGKGATADDGGRVDSC